MGVWLKAGHDAAGTHGPLAESAAGSLCATACHLPIYQAGLKDIFSKEVSRDPLAGLRFKDLIASWPKSPQLGAPHTSVTPQTFLVTFDLQSLRDQGELDLARRDAG